MGLPYGKLPILFQISLGILMGVGLGNSMGPKGSHILRGPLSLGGSLKIPLTTDIHVHLKPRLATGSRSRRSLQLLHNVMIRKADARGDGWLNNIP